MKKEINKLVATYYAARAVSYASRLSRKCCKRFEEVTISNLKWKYRVRAAVAYVVHTVTDADGWEHESIDRLETAEYFELWRTPEASRVTFRRFKKELQILAERSGRLTK